MNRRSLPRLIGLAPVAAPLAAVAVQGQSSVLGRLAGATRVYSGEGVLISTLEPVTKTVGLGEEIARHGFGPSEDALGALHATIRSNGICPSGSNDHHPDGAWAPNAPGLGEGDDGRAVAQGYSAVAEARPDSGSRTGRRNEEVGRDGAGASAEPGRTLGHMNSPDGASDVSPKRRQETGGCESPRGNLASATEKPPGATAGETAPGAGARADREVAAAPAPGLIVHPSYLDLYPNELQPGGAA